MQSTKNTPKPSQFRLLKTHQIIVVDDYLDQVMPNYISSSGLKMWIGAKEHRFRSIK